MLYEKLSVPFCFMKDKLIEEGVLRLYSREPDGPVVGLIEEVKEVGIANRYYRVGVYTSDGSAIYHLSGVTGCGERPTVFYDEYDAIETLEGLVAEEFQDSPAPVEEEPYRVACFTLPYALDRLANQARGQGLIRASDLTFAFAKLVSKHCS